MKTKMTAKFHTLKISLLVAGMALVLRLANAQCDPPPSGLVGWWPLNEIQGTIAYDRAGDADGQVTNIQHVVGEVGGAYRFSTTNALIASGAGSLDISGNQITLEAWVKLEQNLAGNQQHFTAAFGKLTYPVNQTYEILFEAGSNLHVRV